MIKNLLPSCLLVLLIFACANAPKPEQRHVASAARFDCRMACAKRTNDCATVCEGNGDCVSRCEVRGGACTERCDQAALESKAGSCVESCVASGNDCAAACNGNARCINHCDEHSTACSMRCGFPPSR